MTTPTPKNALVNVLAEWEDKFGAMAAIMPHEWSELFHAVTQACIVQSPRQLRSDLATAREARDIATTDAIFAKAAMDSGEKLLAAAQDRIRWYENAGDQAFKVAERAEVQIAAAQSEIDRVRDKCNEHYMALAAAHANWQIAVTEKRLEQERLAARDAELAAERERREKVREECGIWKQRAEAAEQSLRSRDGELALALSENDKLATIRADREEWKRKAEEAARYKAALNHQRTALSLIRDRQCHEGVCTVSLADIYKGIALLDAAIAAKGEA